MKARSATVRIVRLIAAAAMLMLGSFVLAHAQSATATVQGTVTEGLTQAPVAGASVDFTQFNSSNGGANVGASVTTDSLGRYSYTGLTAGDTYLVSARASNTTQRATRMDNIGQLTAGSTTTHNIVLQGIAAGGFQQAGSTCSIDEPEPE